SGASAQLGQQLVISNLSNGLDLYTLPTMQLERTFTHTVAVNLILQVAIIPQRRWVIVGGDDGFIRIFNLDSGNFLFSLVHD
ncbi:hypothetical protein FIBSPDRAFT_690704, partial [Athelia psychrophila]